MWRYVDDDDYDYDDDDDLEIGDIINLFPR